MPLSYRIIKESILSEEKDIVLTFNTDFFRKDDHSLSEEEAPDLEVIAKEKAEQIVAEAELKAKEIQLKAYQKGYSEGIEKAREKGNEIVEKAQTGAREILMEVESFRQNTLDSLSIEIRELAIEVAEKIILQQISLGKEVTTKLVKESIEGLKSRKKVQIFVNPRDLAHVEEEKEYLQRVLDEATFAIFSDPMIKIGGCRIHTEKGWVDATIDSQLRELKTILVGEIA